MPSDIRPRRSVLYMPGSNARALEKARDLPADCLILDLEDAVAPEAKDAARSQVAAAIRAGHYGRREVIVRVNGPDTPWFSEDIAAAGSCGADAVLLPKVEDPDTVREAARLLRKAGAYDDLPIWIMAETPRGIMHLEHIVTEHPIIKVIVLGTSDLAKELRIAADPARTGLLYSLSQAVLVARAQGLDIIDGVHLALDDEAGLRTACQQGRELGFDGKSLIHPRQIAAANEIFGVSESEAASAREIVSAWESARDEGHGVTVVNGKLIEQLHVDAAQRALQIYAASQEA